MRNTFLLALALSGALGGCQNLPARAGSNAADADVFPATGHTYRVDFGGGNAFDIDFTSDHSMTFTKLQPPSRGQVETIHFDHRRIREGLYLVRWQEADRTTVVHLEDFARERVYTHITRPDGSFFTGESALTPVHRAGDEP